jgi:site-specific DNA-methyltransferase (adenine-specific)
MTRLPRNTCLLGDAYERLRELPAGSVDCVVTSPPYFRLRDYDSSGQLGQEGDVHAWVANLRRVLSEVGRVLKPTGSLWLNLGDSFSRGARHGAPPKSLLLGPERLLLQLAEDGWLVRNKIVWAKRNYRPHSARDRFTVSWEPLYLLTRSAEYFFDLDVLRQPHQSKRHPPRYPARARRPATKPGWLADHSGLVRMKGQGRVGHPLGKNPGDVWTVATSNYRGAHFATFPQALVDPALQAGCPRWVCMRCGLPWTRTTARQLGAVAVRGSWAPSCDCGTQRRPGVVLDPFMGSGTVAVVAQRLRRDWVGIDINPVFQAMTETRARLTANDSTGGEHAVD